MPAQSSTTFTSPSKTSTKPMTEEYRDSSSVYSYDPKGESTQRQKDKDGETKRLMQTAYKNSIKMNI
ncbi:hypothetical protein O1611_g6534 [Lasiodiplodia mahajangana]|uniref:Uncharacterized protein n=1 Tax=Lasiodiplodia mahajangana TaxID=1108764 RepID=A0ACC2JI09_9PEZI|nr:hypothetical protein O1611_g6534 [Lasiodiplodia mahajangana]